ncbi:MAG TPA: ABC transporter ATP-binding protein [Candidatus Limnocylindrales bacterium]|nr:ABC transporter ATP-binding protein [Candidatus Limnocylindrales bacterium]
MSVSSAEPSPETPAGTSGGQAQQPAPASAETANRPHEATDSAPTRAVVELRSVSRAFGDVKAVDDISLAVHPGTILGLIGPSGSGKTTAIRLITGALRADSGEVRVLGEEPRHFHRATRERIGYMPQQFVLYPELTARENIDFIGAMMGMLPKSRHARTAEMLELVELQEAADRPVSNLSGGQQRRVALACALVHQPDLLILDEPTAGIDPILRQQIWNELRRLRDEGATLLVTTQYVGEAEYCDSVGLIAVGELIAYAAPEEVRRSALGGDVVQVGTERAFDAESLPSIPGVIQIRQEGPRELLVIAENGAEALPDVQEAIRQAGGEVDWSREYRPTFDEVFAELVTRHRAEGSEGAGAGPGLGAAAYRVER